MSKFQVPVCYPAFSKQNILPTGVVASTAACKSPYDSLAGSAVYWCVALSYWGLGFNITPKGSSNSFFNGREHCPA